MGYAENGVDMVEDDGVDRRVIHLGWFSCHVISGRHAISGSSHAISEWKARNRSGQESLVCSRGD